MAVHYYTGENLEKWRAYTQCRHQLIADPGRQLHKLFGLKYAMPEQTQWNIAAIQGYTRMYMETGDPTPLIEVESGNVFYLGGDVVVDNDGSVVYVFHSKSPPDRPFVDDILTAIEEDKKKAALVRSKL